MKKFFTLAAIFALVFAACGDGGDDGGNTGKTDSITTLQIKNQSSKALDQVTFDSVLFAKENADIIGTWTGVYSEYNSDYLVSLNIADKAWSASIQEEYGYYDETLTGQGTWTRNGNALAFSDSSPVADIRNGTATLSGNILTVIFKVRGFSSTINLTSTNLQTMIKPGSSETKTVEGGSGYIFFNVGSNHCRTQSLVVVEDGEKAVFTFVDSTLVVNTDNPGDAVTLGSL
jgi:hypothetical protein